MVRLGLCLGLGLGLGLGVGVRVGAEVGVEVGVTINVILGLWLRSLVSVLGSRLTPCAEVKHTLRHYIG